MSVDAKKMSGIATRSLEILLERLNAGDLKLPLSKPALQATGLKDFVPVLELLNCFQENSLALLIRIILAERSQAKVLGPELVWTGPEPDTSRSRDTRIVLKSLLEKAERRVLIAGYTFSHGNELLAPLHRRMSELDVEARIFLDIQRPAPGRDSANHINEKIKEFFDRNWRFGSPFPRLFIDPRTAQHVSIVSMHAKCVVVDDAIAFIGSANFTDRGQTRNIEAGVLIDDIAFAGRVAAHWENLINERILQEVEY